MKLQGRNLSAPMQGAEVALLQRELRQLGFAIPPAEFQAKTFGGATQQAVRDFQTSQRLPVTGVVDEQTATAINAAVDALRPPVPAPPQPPQPQPFIVRGQVHQPDGSLFAGGLVRAYDKSIRTEQSLGEATTDRDGRYEIQYAADKLGQPEKKSADLIVRVFNHQPQALASSPTIFNAQPEETVDLTLAGAAPPEPSEYEKLLASLQPALQNTPVAELTEDDVQFLSGQTRTDVLHIVFLVLAARHSAKIQVPPAAFYAWFRQNLPTNLAALLLRHTDALRLALEASLQQNIVPAAIGTQVESILEVLSQPANIFHADGDDAIPALKVLGTTNLPQDKQAKFLHRFAQHDGSPESFWQAIHDDHEFDDEQIKELQGTLQLGLLTRNHAPLIRELKQQQPIASLRELAGMQESDWLALIHRPGVGVPTDAPGANDEEKSRNYVSDITQALAAAFPTATAAAALKRDNRPEHRDVIQFLANRPDFDFDTNIDRYLGSHAEQAFSGVTDREGLTRQLKAMQRVFNVAPKYEHMQALMDEGIDSAYAMTSLSPGSFMEQFGDKLGGDSQAKIYYDQGRRVTEATACVLTNVKRTVDDVVPMVISKASDGFKQLPNLSTLFGAATLCACEECQSVYSPAAYLVDLLQAINPKSGQKPIQQLRKRRPDIENIQLTCENTNTELPYIDLVNEIMEYYVAHNGDLANLPAHNTMDVSAADLSVNPQYRNDRAYQKLRQAVYPPSLPFNRPVAVSRTYLEHLGSSRYQVMQTFQRDHEQATKRAIDAEYLKITTEEYQILTGENLDGSDVTPPLKVAELYGYDQDISPALKRVPEFLRRTELSYSDLSDMLDTHWINPDPQAPDAVVVFSPEANCELNEMVIQHLNGSHLGESILRRIHRFVRLWRKLGWTMGELDSALMALNVNQITPYSLGVLAEIERLRTSLGLPLNQLLGFWANLDADGRESLYIQLFQNKAVLNPVDPAFSLKYGAPLGSRPNVTFDDSVADKIAYDATAKQLTFIGEMTSDEKRSLAGLLSNAGYKSAIDRLFEMRWFDEIELADVEKRISGHTPAILAALRLSAADLHLLRAELSLATQGAPLILANLSAFYRYSVLAKALKLRVVDLLALKTLSGIDPFASPNLSNKFVDFVQRIQQSGFSAAQLNYLYRDLAAPPSGLAPQLARLQVLAKTLRDGLTQIVADNAFANDPTGELTRAKLAVLFESAIVDQVIQMVDGSAVYRAPLASLPAGITFSDSVKSRVSYSAQAQMLQFTGPITADERDDLLAASTNAEYREAVRNLFKQPRIFIAGTLRGFLDVPDATNLLLGTPSVTPDSKTDAKAAAQKFNYILERLLPYLRDQLGHSLVKQALADEFNLESAMADLLLETRRILSSREDPGKPAIDDFLAVQTTGLTGRYFNAEDLTGDAKARIDSVVAFAGGGTKREDKIPTTTGSVRWTGMVLAPNNGDYTFHVRASGGVRLWVGDNQEPVIDALQNQSADELSSGSVAFKAGELYNLRVEMTQLNDQGIAELRWSSAATPKDLIPSANLYPASVFHTFGAAYKLLQKTAMLVNGFNLTTTELAYLSHHAERFADLSLDSLPLDRSVETDPQAPELFGQWQRLNDFTTLRNSLPQGEISLIDVFGAASLDDAQQQLALATGWDAQALDTLAGPTGLQLTAADFKNEIALVRLQSCMQLIQPLGVSADQLFDWAVTAPDSNQANHIAQTVKAKYDDQTWLAVGKGLNDGLRESQKAALIAYLLADATIADRGITDSNQLFEYFLIDLEMSACMMTSRIKQAISSVQLFMQRCLMNLEEHVKPSAIDETQWEWMQNYRVWEANRKVFLYPENWIEPELRDDKSPFFKELETQLLQNDITADTAEDAFLTYLEKLDEVARLEICGMYTQAPTEDSETTTVHVFGRTHHAPRIYYYRQLAAGIWTPWEKVDMDIEGDHLIPIVYNRRLYLFWPHFEKKPNADEKLASDYIQSKEHWQWLQDEPKWRAQNKLFEFVQKDYEAKKSDLDTFQRLIDQYRADNELTEDCGNLGDDPDATLELYCNMRKSKLQAVSTARGQAAGMDPGPEPERPQTKSIPPALCNLAIQLAWSEYKNGKWLPKQTSSEFVVSPFVTRTLEHFEGNRDTKKPPLKIVKSNGSKNLEATIDGSDYTVGTLDTVAVVYLPEPEAHFFRSEVENDSGDLLISIYRRYSHTYKVLDLGSAKMSAYAKLGRFRVQCGAKVRASTVGQLDSLDFDSLSRPDGSNNSFMAFEHQDGPERLSVTSALEILKSIPDTAGEYNLLHEHQFKHFDLTTQSFFYQDHLKTYFAHLQSPPAADNPLVHPSKINGGYTAAQVGPGASEPSSGGRPPSLESGITGAEAAGIAAVIANTHIRFEAFFHPHVCEFFNALYRAGLPGLLNRSLQETDNDTHNKKKNVFLDLYDPSSIVDKTAYPRENVDFESGAYSLYNWELFFHAPMLIATRLGGNQQFEDAMEWFHYIFNPTSSSNQPSPQRYWNTLPFFNNSDPENDQIQILLSALDSDEPAAQAIKDQVMTQIATWANDPFNPHLIARMRITAYQKNVVMKYIDNLIQWGDQLFSQDTIETINQATLLYVLAYSILGPRPEVIPSKVEVEPQTYSDLQPRLDSFSNALVRLENEGVRTLAAALSNSKESVQKNSAVGPAMTSKTPTTPSIKSIAGALYFAIPQNDDMLQCWDTVADRLFKIRHCMNIEGVVRELPLFEPPIDPALLVRAAAVGLDLSSVLNDINAPAPYYRFSYMLQKALEICGELKSLSGALLSALEKKDAEALSMLRAGHEIALLTAVREVKKKQIDEANEALEGLNKSKAVIEARRDYYRDIARINANEQEHLDKLGTAHVFNDISQVIRAGVAMSFGMPSFDIGTAGWASSPLVKVAYGGLNVGNALQGASELMTNIAAQYTHEATMASVMGGYDRRWLDYKQQENLANRELNQIDKQIAAAEIRAAIATMDKENQELQIENSQAVEEFLRSKKYTNEDLYGWMTAQISSVYFQAYKLAYDIAKRAEKAYRFERGLTSSDFIKFGYWDSLKKGLLAGEQLALDLKRMEAAYLDQNKREYEITKHFSLVLNDPLALIALKETGQCEIELPEALFDADYPGHYMRRIKSVSLTLPCVVGPYAGVNCTLTLLSNKIRANSLASPAYPESEGGDDDRFIVNFAAAQSIATSHAQNDAGMFELNFRDERYLPFEGAGAISRWRIELPKYTNAFDFSTLNDVVLHLKYTAREGGEILRKAATDALQNAIKDSRNAPLARLFSLKHEFPSDWYRFFHPPDDQTDQTLKLELTRERFPFQFRGRNLEISQVELFFKLKDEKDPAPGAGKTYLVEYANGTALGVSLTPPGGSEGSGSLASSPSFMDGLPHLVIPVTNTVTVPVTFELRASDDDIHKIASGLRRTVTAEGATHYRVNQDAVEDMIIVCRYSVSG